VKSSIKESKGLLFVRCIFSNPLISFDPDWERRPDADKVQIEVLRLGRNQATQPKADATVGFISQL